MKTFILAACILVPLLFTSCIKDEALNREADIESFSFPGNIMLGVSIDEADALIRVTITKGADITSVAPVIELTEGATVSPKSGEPCDFSDNRQVIYTVTSEDGKWTRRYVVTASSTILLEFDFEKWKTTPFPKYDNPLWSSGNEGLGLIKPSVYPTRSTEDCVGGKYAAMLETRKGAYVEMIGKNFPVFSGSLFTGKFNTLNALLDPLTAPQFGQPHTEEYGKPIALIGYYKYKVGYPFLSSTGAEIAGRLDSCTVRAVLYKVTKGEQGVKEYLTPKNITTSDKIVAWADMEDCTEQPEFAQFVIPFVYYEDIDYSLHDYKLAIIFASSRKGDSYEGAVGSTLIIDDVKVVCEPLSRENENIK